MPFHSGFGNEQYKVGPGSDTVAAGLEPPMTNLQYWLKADAGVTGTTPITAWTDQSGNAASFTPGGTGPDLIAAAINGLPVARFVADEAMHATVSSSIFNGISGATVACVFQTSFNAVGDDYLMGIPNSVGGNNGFDIRMIADDTIVGDVITTSGNVLGAPATTGAINDGTPRMVTLVWENSTPLVSLYEGSTLSNSTGGAVTGTLLATAGQWGIGGHSTGNVNGFTGDIGEVLVYNTDLGASDRTDLWDYLSARWGITL